METLPTGEAFNPLLAEALSGERDEDLGPNPFLEGEGPGDDMGDEGHRRGKPPRVDGSHGAPVGVEQRRTDITS